MKHASILILILLASLSAACSDDKGGNSGRLPDKGIVIELSTGQLDTKAHLYSQASLHHVNRVYAVLYHCPEDVGGDTTVVASQLLMKGSEPWNPSDDEHNYRPGQPQTETFELHLPQEDIFKVPGWFMIVCVGLDEASGETYGLTYEKTPAFIKRGASLSEAKAVLAKEAKADPIRYEKDPSANPDTEPKQDKDLIAYGQPDIAHSELFAGWQAFDFMPDDLNVVRVELRRRVAGVLCYLSDIPYKLNIGETPYRVTEVRLNLFGKQNSQISLLRKVDDLGKPNLEDFGTAVAGKEVCETLCKFDLMGFKPQANTSGDDMLYAIPTSHLNGRKQLENTILMGAYVLPIHNAIQDNFPTLELELWGLEYDDSSDDHITEGSTLTKIKSFPAIYEEQKNPEVYDLHPNMIYHIGHKQDNDNTEGDYPESLAGTKVTVEADDWHEIDIPVEFPDVPIVPMMSLRDNEGNKYKTEPEEDGDDYYIFDCIGSTGNLKLGISSSILYKNWNLTVLGDGIEFWDNASSRYVKVLSGSGSQDIYIRMADYVSVSDWQDGEETRKFQIQLQALDKEGNLVADATSTFTVEQYNALIVDMEDSRGDGGYRGFSHFNYRAKRNTITGAVEYDGDKIQWGYFRSLNVTPDWANGYSNYWEFITSTWIDDFYGSAIQVCALGKYGKELQINYDNATSEDPLWYLPACDELEWFLNQYKNKEVNIKRDQFYWTCNQAGFWLDAFVHKLTQSGEFVWDKHRKDNWYYARQACHAQ